MYTNTSEILITAQVNSSHDKYTSICINMDSGNPFGTTAETIIYSFPDMISTLGSTANQYQGKETVLLDWLPYKRRSIMCQEALCPGI